MKSSGQVLALAIAIILAFTMSFATFAAGGQGADMDSGGGSGTTDKDSGGGSGTANIKKRIQKGYESVDGEKYICDDSYNLDEDTVGWRFSFIGEDYLDSVSVSNNTDFSAEVHGTMSPYPDDNSYIMFTIVIDLLHNPYKEFNETKTFSTDVTLTLKNGKSATFEYEFNITDEPILSDPEFYDGETKVKWNCLEAGKTYTLKTAIVDKAQKLKGKETRISLYADEEDEEYIEIVNGAFSQETPLSLKVLKIGTFAPRLKLEEKNGSTWDEVYDMGWDIDAESGTPDAVEEIDNDTIDSIISNATGSGDSKTANLSLADNNVLTAEGLDYLKTIADENGVGSVTLKPENEDVSISFNPAEIDTSKLNGKPFTASVRSTRPSEIDKVTGITENKGGSWVDFDFSGELPAPMTITVKIDPSDYPNGITSEDFRIWYYNETTKKMEQKNIPVTYNAANQTVSFTLDHFSAYLILDKDSAPEIIINENKSHSKSSSRNGEARQASINSSLAQASSRISSFSNSFKLLEDGILDKLPLADSEEAKALTKKATANGLETTKATISVNGVQTTVIAPLLTIESNGTNYFTPEQINSLRGKKAVIKVVSNGSEYVFYTWNIAPEEANRILYPFEYLARTYHIELVK